MQKIVALENKKIQLHFPMVSRTIRFACSHFKEKDNKLFMMSPDCSVRECKIEDLLKITIAYTDWKEFTSLVKEPRALVLIDDFGYLINEYLYFVYDEQSLGDKADTVELRAIKVNQLELLQKLGQ